MGIRERLTEGVRAAAEASGNELVPRERLQLLEASDSERRRIQRDLDLLAYTAMDYIGGAPQELKAVERRKLAQQSRVAWMKDPQAGAAIDLMNDFTFGRGIPRPKAQDKIVQEVIDEAWDDPDNQLVLTSYAAQLALGTDLSMQSNLFFIVFDDGDDGKVKLSILDHDSVETVVRDPDNRLRILYYVAQETRQEWDFKNDMPKAVLRPAEHNKKVRYYEHWRNIEDAQEDAENGLREMPELAPKAKQAEGRVFHVAINKTTEMAFGHPVMDRLLRWYNAYNKFMDARVDIMEASAAFVMKRKVKGTPNQVQKMATQMLSRRSALGQSIDNPDLQAAPRPGSILTENENVTHEDFNINTNAPAAAEDSRMLRAQISAATRFPQSYYGDAANSSLATATSLELPVLKAVENRQEVFESVVRFFVDKVIERAVEAGRLPSEYSEEERAEMEAEAKDTLADESPGGAMSPETPNLALVQAHDDAVEDEKATARDLGYEFSMPSPLKRMMTDLVTSVMNIAKTFDPNNTNVELSRALLQVALSDALEIEDAAGLVEKIFPEGYVDPMLAAQQQAPPGDEEDPQFGEFAPNDPGPLGADGQRHPDPRNPYGAPMNARAPGGGLMQQAALTPADKKRIAKRRAELDNELAEEIAGALDSGTKQGSKT
jgi:hypothetical protein